MQSGSFWAFREAAELPDYEPPEHDFTSLWDKVHVARKPHLCSVCREEIAPGARYRSIGFILDGRFEAMKEHGDGGYPSTCPKWAGRDRQEMEAQFEADRADFFPAESPRPQSEAKPSASVAAHDDPNSNLPPPPETGER
jgi:hypothetical protein